MSYIYDIDSSEVAMTISPAPRTPDRIFPLDELVEAGGYVAVNVVNEGEFWGASYSGNSVIYDAKCRMFEQYHCLPVELDLRPATRAAVDAICDGRSSAVILDERLDLFACVDEIKAADDEILMLTNQWRSWIESQKPSWADLGPSDQGDKRSSMMEEMTWAYANRVSLVGIRDGQPVWRPGLCAISCPDMHWRTHEETQLLSPDLYRAAEEIKVCLGNAKWVEEIAPSPRHQLRDIGEAIWGAEWVSLLARTLGVATRTAQRWASGDSPIPDHIFSALAPTISRAKQRMQERLEALGRF
jgi:hypothetical protein